MSLHRHRLAMLAAPAALAALALLMGRGQPHRAITAAEEVRLAAEARVADADRAALAEMSPIHKLLGAGSCAAGPCHGGRWSDGGPDAWRSACHVWAYRDPHALAYATLLMPQSRQIAQRLGPEKLGGTAQAHRARLCLGCHSAQALAAEPLPPSLLAQGVGCESCHGAAEAWQRLHHDRSRWPALDASRQATLGFVPLNTPRARVERCVGCHVGSGQFEVDHDLIAAGHPRLAFEASAYLDRLPKHWNTGRPPDNEPSYPARTWALGQVASLAALCEMTADRNAAHAQRHRHAPAWIELADYDCFACHRPLRAGQGAAPPASGRLGHPAWGSWYLPLARAVASQAKATAGVDGLPAVEQVDALAARLQFDAAAPASAVAEQAALAAQRFDALADSLEAAHLDATAWPIWIDAALAAPHAASQWDAAGQLYLAMAACTHAARPAGPAPADAFAQRRQLLQAMMQQLRFPPGQDSPGALEPPLLRRIIEQWQAADR